MADYFVPIMLIAAAAVSYSFVDRPQSGGGALYDRMYKYNKYNPFKLHVFHLDAQPLDDTFLPRLNPAVPLPETDQKHVYRDFALLPQNIV